MTNMTTINQQSHRNKQRLGRRAVGGQKFCNVCGEKAKSFNYGGISCHCCKSFFRHAILNKLVSSYVCKFKGNCTITKETRKKCKKCRFEKCVTAGMETSWVLTEKLDEKSSQNVKLEPEQELKLTKEELEKIKSLHSFYREACESIPYHFPHRRENEPLTITKARVVIIGITSTSIRRLVYFAKLLPEFQPLPSSDQENLLKQSAIQTILLRGAYKFEIDTATIFPLYRHETDFEQYPYFRMDEISISNVFPPDLWNMQKQLYTRLNNIEADENSIMLLFTATIFSETGCPQLLNESGVKSAQDLYVELLRKYLIVKHGIDKGRITFARLLSQLCELRQVSELHQGLPLVLSEAQVNKMHQLVLQLQNKATAENSSNGAGKSVIVSPVNSSEAEETKRKDESPGEYSMPSPSSNLSTESAAANFKKAHILQLMRVFVNVAGDCSIKPQHFSTGPQVGVERAFMFRIPQLLQNPMDCLVYNDDE